MSIFARTPESDAAWHQLKRNVALGPDAQRSPRKERSRELQLLFAGTRQKKKKRARRLFSLSELTPHPHFATRSLT
jgi:hypothetical protein